MNEESIFAIALEKDDRAERAAYLEEACAGDPGLHRQVQALLESHEQAGSFLEQPALGQQAGTANEDDAGATPTQPVHGDGLSLDSLFSGRRLGDLGRLTHYEVQGVVGQGGMGVVLKGFDEVLKRVVAIKVMTPQLATSPSARKRFLREAQAAAAVRNEHVVDIYAVEGVDGLPFLVMEFVNGISLQERLDRVGPLELKETLRIGMQTAAGLAAAHQQGLIHRDVKPANILLENGVQRVRITDFGLARTVVDDASISHSGVVAGTPQYMAPEQARGEPVDHRADLFSLGSLLYAMCAGQPPFRASTTMAVLKQVAEDAPRPLREVNPESPDWLAEIIEKLHAKDRALRFQSAAEVAELLGRHLAHLQGPAIAPMPPRITTSSRAPLRRRLRSRWAAAAALVLLAMCGLGLTEAAGVTKLVPTVIRILTPSGALVVEVDDPQAKVALDADGREIVVAGVGIHELRLRLGTYRWHAIRDGEIVKEDWVTITRNGKTLVRVRPESGTRQVGALEGARPGDSPATSAARSSEVLLPVRQFGPHGINVNCVAYVPGGRQIVSASADGTLRLWDVTSGTEIRRFKGHAGPVEGVAVSPGGNTILSCSQDKTVRLWELATAREIRRFVAHAGWVYGVAFSPDGKLALSAGTSWGGTTGDFLCLWNVETGHEIHRFHGHGDAILAVTFAPDGRSALSASFDTSVRLWDVATGRELRRFPHTSRVYAVAFSPDGWHFVSGCGGSSLRDGAVFDPVNCVVRLWDVDTDREVRQFRGHTAGIRAVAWSPDGRYVLSATSGEYFGVNQQQPPSEVGIRLWEAATGKQLCRFNTPNSISSLVFSAEGSHFLSAGANGLVSLWALPQSVSSRRVFTRPAQRDPAPGADPAS
jgi:WD40 repeat protein/tRNA A-37 threonylcarbamoyl transferase component Bud32